MSWIIVVLISTFGLSLLALITFVQRRKYKIDRDYFNKKWQEISKLQQSDSNWVEAIVSGDKLVDEALKRRRYKGKSMGERLADANRTFKDSDMIWAAHKIRNKVVHETDFKLNKKHVSYALRGFRKALKDLEVL